MVKYNKVMGDNAEKRHQPVSPDQDIWNQQWSVEQAAEEFIYFDAYRGDFMQNSGLPRGGCDGDRVR